jgi:predicted transcriptional regulator
MVKKTTVKQDQVNGLSPIEAEIMRLIWVEDKTTVRGVHEELLKSGYIPYTTVMAAMHNLAKKGLLKQNKKNRAYSYTPLLTNLEVAKQIVDNVIDRILDGKPDSILRHLLKIKGDEELARLFLLRDQLYAK